MSDKQAWPDFSQDEAPLAQLVKISRFYGSDPEFVLAGGGNTSVKTADLLYVKGSGHALATVGPEGFVVLEREPLRRMLADPVPPADPEAREAWYKKTIMGARTEPEKGQRPSVEAAIHHLLPAQFVVHTHSTLVNMLTCCVQGESIAKELFGDDALWIPYVDPGFTLARVILKRVAEYAERTGRACPPAIIMANHGLIVCGETPAEIKATTDKLIAAIRTRLKEAEEPFGAVDMLPEEGICEIVSAIGPTLRGLLSDDGRTLPVVRFDDSEIVRSLVGGEAGFDAAAGGPLFPDQIVYCQSWPMRFDAGGERNGAALLERLRVSLDEHLRVTGYAPRVVLVRGAGMFAIGDDIKGAVNAGAVYTDVIRVMAGARALGGINYLTTEQRRFIETWEVEAYRRQIAAAGRRGGMGGKVVAVTGAAQGFGLEICQQLAAEGAHVVMLDINADGVAREAAALARRHGAGRVAGFHVDVTRRATIEEAIQKTIRAFGGFDVFISNAGVLKAESVLTQSERDFDFVTSVNYRGYFLCTQVAAPVLALQHRAAPGYRSDIIQINSKSGLVGSNRNGAYAGAKFGGIGLTQSFALELIESGIKVNSICPGNFFDGPLWSDPENGLFVQYLRTGKVPGAKTIEDVRRAYESKVPMGRGCQTQDVVRAILYLVDQQYETGQALPVTGGQVMLH